MLLQKSPNPLEQEQSLETAVLLLQDQVADLEAQLARSERLATLGAMSGAIAHEFNNILTPLLSYAGLALADLDDADLVRKALEKSIQSAERASQVAEALLGTGPAPDDPNAECSLRDTVEAALASMIRPPAADGIEVLIDVPADYRVAMNAAALHQVLLNLILNACDAMSPGPGTLAFTASRMLVPQITACTGNTNKILSHQSSERIVLRVVDTGPGMASEVVARVFEPLVTTKIPAAEGERGGKRGGQRGGSGLGLTVCKRLVEQAGGEITIRSQLAVGTSFALRLPVASSPDCRLAA